MVSKIRDQISSERPDVRHAPAVDEHTVVDLAFRIPVLKLLLLSVDVVFQVVDPAKPIDHVLRHPGSNPMFMLLSSSVVLLKS